MPGDATREITQHLRQLFNEGTLTGLSDGQLLDRFRETGDEMAFTALVARHGPMVLEVCGAVLRNPADAEDAFQAAFLVLARRAGEKLVSDHFSGRNWCHWSYAVGSPLVS